jgi:hypothetical protein
VGECGYDLCCIKRWVQWCLGLLAQDESSLCASRTKIAPSLKSAYVVYSRYKSQLAHSEWYCPTMANSILFPRLTATRSPLVTPMFWNPRAKALLRSSSSPYVRRCLWCLEITLPGQSAFVSYTGQEMVLVSRTLAGHRGQTRSWRSALGSCLRAAAAVRGQYKRGSLLAFTTDHIPREAPSRELASKGFCAHRAGGHEADAEAISVEDG